MTEPLKDSKGKSAIEYIIPDFILDIGHILRMGAEKYAPNSWKGVSLDLHYASAMRHLLAWRKGEKLDKESGFHHLLHVSTNCMFIIFNEKEDKKDNCKQEM